MHTPASLAERFLETFDKGAVDLLRPFVAVNPVTKWLIGADFALHDPRRPADVFAFTIVPYDVFSGDFEKEVDAVLPRDLKRSKSLEAEAAEWLRSPRAFHIALRVDRGRQIFDNGAGGGTPLDIAREHLDLTIKAAEGHPRVSAQSLKRFKRLRQEANAKSFPVDLLSDVWLLGFFFALLTVLIGRERKPEMVGWFPDRDNMTTWCGGVWQEYADWGVQALCEAIELDLRSTELTIALPEQTGKKMWFDHVIRAPDWFAGTVAAWHIDANLCPGDYPKYKQMLEEVIADNERFVLFNMMFSPQGVGFSRVLATRTPTSVAPE